MRALIVGIIVAIILEAGTIGTVAAESSPPGSSPLATPTPSASSGPPIINLIFHWDFNVIGEAVQKALQDVFGGIAQGIEQHVFTPITQSSLNFLTRTPPAGTYANATVSSLWSYSRAVASLGFVLILVVTGYSIMIGHATATPFADALRRLRD